MTEILLKVSLNTMNQTYSWEYTNARTFNKISYFSSFLK